VLAIRIAVFRKVQFQFICPLGDKSGEGGAYGNIGNALDSLSRYDEALVYHKKTLEIAQQTGRNTPITAQASDNLI
jgi:hypothetical protein